MNKAEFEDIKRHLAYILKKVQGGSLSAKEARELAPLWKKLSSIINLQIATGIASEREERRKEAMGGGGSGRDSSKGHGLEGD